MYLCFTLLNLILIVSMYIIHLYATIVHLMFYDISGKGTVLRQTQLSRAILPFSLDYFVRSYFM